MKILRNAAAGTLESNDALITVEPSCEGIKIDVRSVVARQYGEKIREAVMDVLTELDVKNAVVGVNDRGALECTLKARTETAVFRASKED